MGSVIKFNDQQMARIENTVRKVEQSAQADIDSAILEVLKLQSEVSSEN